MSITEAVGRIQQIESQMVQLAGGQPAQTAQTTSAAASAFATSLAAATGTTGAQVTPAAGQQASNGTTGADIVADARKYLGVPYVFGGTTSAGLDCSGLVQRVYGDMGISLPRLVSGQSTIGQAVPSLADAQPGDLIVCNGGEHIVIYAGNGKIIQAPKPGGSVEEMDNWISPSNVVTIRRIVPTATAATSATMSASSAAALASLLGSGGSASSLASLLGSNGGSSVLGLLGSSGGSALSGLLGSGGGSALAALLGQSSGVNS
ncbi:C40 family peptidase [Leifsonia shinshuensis]|uniref:NlpC/P60 family protein n=1 Tax=Leifsonia shinshuensis TaxID=150026 RepID=A0A7G6YCQ1_9MICO|nr:C40 family peptidase [Leifsonia shinshuensis]QNE36266.1 NlpC/P60 family protein [Leifsonia shinshuensis]